MDSRRHIEEELEDQADNCRCGCHNEANMHPGHGVDEEVCCIYARSKAAEEPESGIGKEVCRCGHIRAEHTRYSSPRSGIWYTCEGDEDCYCVSFQKAGTSSAGNTPERCICTCHGNEFAGTKACEHCIKPCVVDGCKSEGNHGHIGLTTTDTPLVPKYCQCMHKGCCSEQGKNVEELSTGKKKETYLHEGAQWEVHRAVPTPHTGKEEWEHSLDVLWHYLADTDEARDYLKGFIRDTIAAALEGRRDSGADTLTGLMIESQNTNYGATLIQQAHREGFEGCRKAIRELIGANLRSNGVHYFNCMDYGNWVLDKLASLTPTSKKERDEEGW